MKDGKINKRFGLLESFFFFDYNNIGDYMKKLTIFSLHLGYGGIEKSVVNLANLLSNDYDVEIVSTYKLEDTPAFDINDNVKVRYLITKYKPNKQEWKQSIKKIRPIKFIKESYKAIVVLINKRRKTVEAIKNCDSDIIISTRDLFNKWVGNYAKKSAYRIGWEHNHHHNNISYANNLIKCSKDLDVLVLVSDVLRGYYKKLMKEANYKCKCVFIPNMIESVPDTLSSLNEHRIISIGRLSKEKGFLDLIEIYRRFKKRNPNTDWHLDIIGDGAERNKIVDRIYNYGLAGDITVHGYLKRKELLELLTKSSVYVMTSFTESFGIVLIEAMSTGIPCLAFTSAEGANDLITNDYNGYLIEDRNKDEMVNKIEELINNRDKRYSLGKNARSFSLNFSSNTIKKQWLDLLKRKG